MGKYLVIFLVALGSFSMLLGQENPESWASAQKTGKALLKVNYFENDPFFYRGSTHELLGLEFEILQEFSHWAKAMKGVDVSFEFLPYTDFESFYLNTKRATVGTVGSGSVSIKKLRIKEARFSKAYLKNIAVLVSSIEVNSLTDYSLFSEIFKGRKAVVVKGSSHEKEMNRIKRRYFKTLEIEYVNSPDEVLSKILGNPLYFGYIDLISYRAFTLRKEGLLRAHRVADRAKDSFGFMFPKSSDWNKPFNQFLKGGFFRLAEYHKIMDNYLDIQTINEVQMK
ncbi:MAG: ABC transporter substrate-binding protein [Flavobacteriales bacterium]|nr:ABC transporter substrate-binding protein [Flavobacteriales bacterium]